MNTSPEIKLNLNPNSHEIKNNSTMNDYNLKSLYHRLALIDDFRNLVHIVRTKSPVLYKIVLFNLLLTAICFVGLVVDDRMLTGVNVWLKPFKFAISTAIYIFTFGFYTTLYPFSDRKRKFLNGFVAWTLLLEMLIIFVQGARGINSHYNMSNPVDGMLYAAMGILIGLNVMVMVFLIIETIRLKMKTSKSIQWSILIGWVVIVVGSWVGGQMIGQLSHTVGAADGGDGIALLNWSTIAGDLRVAHFFGVHGLQIIPLFAYLISRRLNWGSTKQIMIVTIFSFVFIAWLAFTFYQAKQGMPLIGLK